MWKFLFVIGFTSAVSILSAQEYAFRVLVNKGTSKVKSENGWQPLRVGASLKVGDELRIPKNAAVGLVYVSGLPLELKKEGTYKVADLEAIAKAGLPRYPRTVKYVSAVEPDDDALKVYLPTNQYTSVYSNIVYINWEEIKGPFIVTFINMFDDVLLKVETSKNSVIIDLNDPKFDDEPAILVEVRSLKKGIKPSMRYLLKRLSLPEHDKIRASYEEITKKLTEESAPNKIALASFFEENMLLIDAITAYEEAIKLVPDNLTYKNYYEEFLLRNKLKVIKQ